MSVLAGITSVYMILLFIRILLTWFSGADFGRPYAFLCSICDPYLAWFRRFRLFKNSPIDFSPIIALAVLSLVHNVFISWGRMGRFNISIILILLLNALWSVVLWIMGFFIVILVLRMIAFLGNSNIYSPFWRFVDFIAQPVMYRISRIFFPNRIVSYLFRIIFSIAILAAVIALFYVMMKFGIVLLTQLPF
ncbi:MAG: YggT family protein [Treponema sp.]|nr:YggT family protein [Treponema sp.]